MQYLGAKSRELLTHYTLKHLNEISQEGERQEQHLIYRLES